MRTDLIPITLDKEIARVIEESGEVLKAIGKYYRFGPTATDPKTLISYDNTKDLKNELYDLQDSIKRLLKHLNEQNTSPSKP